MEEEPAPAGHYATEEGWGQLSIRPASGGVEAFSITTNSTGTSGCELKGTLKRGIGTARNGSQACSIRFRRIQDGVQLVADSTSTACRDFCGANGSFEGEYRAILPLCTPTGVNKVRRAFSQDYKAKQYANSAMTLRSLLDRCTQVLDEFQLGAIRNDLALAQYKDGDRGACIATLEPYRNDANRQDDDIAKDWSGGSSGSDLATKYLTIVRAARTNLRMCSR